MVISLPSFRNQLGIMNIGTAAKPDMVPYEKAVPLTLYSRGAFADTLRRSKRITGGVELVVNLGSGLQVAVVTDARIRADKSIEIHVMPEDVQQTVQIRLDQISERPQEIFGTRRS